MSSNINNKLNWVVFPCIALPLIYYVLQPGLDHYMNYSAELIMFLLLAPIFLLLGFSRKFATACSKDKKRVGDTMKEGRFGFMLMAVLILIIGIFRHSN